MEQNKPKLISLNLWFKILMWTTVFLIFDNLINKFILS